MAMLAAGSLELVVALVRALYEAKNQEGVGVTIESGCGLILRV
jgi:hypothetical protein